MHAGYWNPTVEACDEVGTLPDKLRVAWLRSRVCRGSVNDAFGGPDVSTLDFLHECGFSSNIIERFFRPFLGGIFLERELRTSSSMFRFVFRMLARGNTSIPSLGMQQIPIQLASSIPSGNLRASKAKLPFPVFSRQRWRHRGQR